MKKHFYALVILLIGSMASVFSQSKTIGGGFSGAVAICNRGLLYTWGAGTASPQVEPLPKDPANPLKDLTFSQVNGGSGNHFVALSCYKTVYARGNNGSGQCGRPPASGTDWVTNLNPILKGQTPGYNALGEPNPNPVGNPNDPNYPYLGGVKYVTASDAACFAILNTGELVGWGGPSGTWITTASSTPVYINYAPTIKGGARMTDVIHITAGDVTAYICVDETGNGLGTVYYIGNYAGANSNVARPILREDNMQPLTNIKMAAAADVCGFAVDVDGMVWSWGHGAYECATAYGWDHNHAKLVPSGNYKRISGEDFLTDVKDIVGGNGYGLTVTKEGYVVSWGPYMGGCNNTAGSLGPPQFMLYCDNGGTSTTMAQRDTVKNAVNVARSDRCGFMVNDKDEYYAAGTNQDGGMGIPGVSSTTCFRRLNLPCVPIDVCPEVAMPPELYKCPEETMSLFSGYVTPVGKEERYYFSWYHDGVRLNSSSKQEAQDALEAGTPISDPYSKTRIDITESGLYRVEVDYIGTNIPCEDCPTAIDSVMVLFKEMKIDTVAYDVCVANIDRPVASEEICYEITSKYTIPSEYELYTSQNGGTLLQKFSFPATGNKTAQFCVTGDKVGVEKISADQALYTVWLEDKTVDRGTLMGAPTPCTIGSGGQNYGYEDVTLLTAYKPIILESYSIYVDFGAAGQTFRAVIYANQMNGAEFRPNKTAAGIIKRGDPVVLPTGFTGEIVLPINFSWEGNRRGISYWIGYEKVTGSDPGIRKDIGCPLPKWDEKDGETLRAVLHGTGSNNATDLTNRALYNITFRTLSSFDCGRMKLFAPYYCPCPEVAPLGPVCSEEGSFTMVKTPAGVKGNWNSSNPAFSINEFGGVIIPEGLSADTDVTFRFTATSSGCWDEKTVRILAECYEQICPDDPFNPGVADNLCFELKITPPPPPADATSTYTIYNAATSGDSITTFSLGYGTRRKFCVSGDKIDKIHAIAQSGTNVVYSLWADENKLAFYPDTIIPVYDTITVKGGTLARAAGEGTCTLNIPAKPGPVYNNSTPRQLAGMFITPTDSLKINSLAVRASGTNNGNPSTIGLQAVIYEVDAGDNIGAVLCRGSVTTRTEATAAATFTLNFGAGCGNLAKNKKYFISYEVVSETGRVGNYDYCYTGTFGAPTLGGLTVGTQTANVINDISYDKIIINTLPPIIKPGAPYYIPQNNRVELTSECESLCTQPVALTTTPVVLCAGDTPVPDITLSVSGLIGGHTMVWYSSTEALSGPPVISNVNTGTAPLVTTYYVSQKVDNCESVKEPITVTVNPIPVLSSALTAPAICSETTFSYNAESATAGTNFSWSRAAVANITEAANSGLTANISEILTNSSTNPVTVTYGFTLSANGCTNTNTQNVTVIVNPLPTVGITNNSGTTVLTCAAPSISLTATGGVSYSWDNGLGNNAGATVDAIGTYTVTATDANGCVNTASITITEDKAKPTAGITNNSGTTQLTCAEPNISLTATGGVSYSWDNGLGNNADATVTTVGTYTVTVTAANGCTDTESITITTDGTMPVADIINNTSTTVLTCTVTSISLTATGGVSYSWDNGLGDDADATVTTIGTYTVTVTDANGCTDTKTITITEDKAEPIGGITNNSATTELTCTTLSISLTATGGVSYLWSNGDNVANTAITTAGTHNVIITGANGCTGTQSITITENKTPPTAGITNNSATTELTCTVTSISLTATGGGTYSWSNSLGSNANVTVNTAGTYVVTVTGSNGCTAPASITITTDGSRPTAGIINNTGVIVLTCTTPSISLTATGGGTYSWNNGLGGNANATVTSAGTYTVTVTDTNGCTDTESITITENKAEPNGSITNNSATTVLTCAKPSISLTATGGVSYLWSNGDNTANTTITAAGTYNVIITGTNGCTGTRSITITADGSLPTIVITTSPATTELTCTTPSITLTASGGVSYSWDNSGNSASITVTSAGIYTVDVTSANGCVANKSIEITSNQSLPTIRVNNADICLGGEAVLMASGANTYAWTPSGGLSATTGASVTASPTVTTTYTVEGTDTETGCKNTTTAIVYVESPIGLTLDAPKSVELGSELTITVSAERTDHGYFEWFINDQPYKIISEYNLTLVPDAGKQHFLVHTATTKLNCPSSSEIFVEVSESVPNVINPHDPSGRNCCFMIGYHVEIYNRYMQKVFEGNDGWNGTYRGAVADPGTYFYRLYKKGGQVEKGTLEVVKF